jgi:membrane protein required for colicin V production
MDRLLGAGLGLVRGVLLGVAVMMAMTAFSPRSAWIRNSLLAPYFLAGAHAVSFVVPQHLQQQMAEGTRHLVEKTPGMLKQAIPPQ